MWAAVCQTLLCFLFCFKPKQPLRSLRLRIQLRTRALCTSGCIWRLQYEVYMYNSAWCIHSSHVFEQTSALMPALCLLFGWGIPEGTPRVKLDERFLVF